MADKKFGILIWPYLISFFADITISYTPSNWRVFFCCNYSNVWIEQHSFQCYNNFCESFVILKITASVGFSFKNVIDFLKCLLRIPSWVESDVSFRIPSVHSLHEFHYELIFIRDWFWALSKDPSGISCRIHLDTPSEIPV